MSKKFLKYSISNLNFSVDLESFVRIGLRVKAQLGSGIQGSERRWDLSGTSAKEHDSASVASLQAFESLPSHGLCSPLLAGGQGGVHTQGWEGSSWNGEELQTDKSVVLHTEANGEIC